MKGMTTQERYEDICRISGMSEEVVRRVIRAEKESIIKSLKKGERATLIGRCVIRPEIRGKIEIGGDLRNYVKLASDVSSALESALEGMERFEDSEIEDEELGGIRVNQISSLV